MYIPKKRRECVRKTNFEVYISLVSMVHKAMCLIVQAGEGGGGEAITNRGAMWFQQRERMQGADTDIGTGGAALDEEKKERDVGY